MPPSETRDELQRLGKLFASTTCPLQEHPAFAGVPHHRTVPPLPYTLSCATLGTLVRTCVLPPMRVERLFFATWRDCSTVHVHFGLYIIVREIYWFTSRTGVEFFRLYKRVYDPLYCLPGACRRDIQRWRWLCCGALVFAKHLFFFSLSLSE